MRKNNSLRLTLALMLIVIMLTGYGGLCKKSSDDDDVVAGSSGGDTTAPTVSATNPVNNAVDIPATTIITATFNEAMNSSTITNSTFTLVWSGGAVTGTVGYDTVSLSGVFTPTANLDFGTAYTATITTGVKDSAGNALAANYSWMFTTQRCWYGAELIEIDDIGDAIYPHIAIDPDGNAIAVWHQHTGSGFYSIFANRYVSGAGWGTAELLETDDTGGAEAPQIAFDSAGNAIAVWDQNTGTGFYSIFANRYVSGTGWGTAELLETDDADFARYPHIAIDPDGNAIAVWRQNTGTGFCSIFANRYVSGTGWGTAQLLETDDAGDAGVPQIAIDPDNNAIAVWGQNTGTGKYSLFANHYVSGTGWGTAGLLETDDAGHAENSQIAIDPAGNAIAVWYQNTGTGFCSIFANRYISGTGWGVPQLLETDDTGHARYSEIAIDSAGNAIAVWYQNTGTVNSIFANRYVSGTGWGLPQLLESDDAQHAYYPQIAIDSAGNAIAVWYQSTGTFNSIFANRYVSGMGWGIAQLLEADDTGAAENPQIAIDSAGNAIAVWYQSDGTRYNIWANRFE